MDFYHFFERALNFNGNAFMIFDAPFSRTVRAWAEDHLLPRVELRVDLHAVWRQFDRQHGKNLGVEREGVLVRREDGGDHLHRHLFE